MLSIWRVASGSASAFSENLAAKEEIINVYSSGYGKIIKEK